MSKEAMKLALEALEPLVRRAAPWGELDWLNGCKAISALREALAEPDFWEGYVPEPVKPAPMTKDEAISTERALDLALEALEIELSIDWTNNDEFNASAEKMHEAITAIKQARALDKKAENARELGLDYEPAQQEPVACKHEWFSTGAMETGQCRCIKCGVWNTTLPAQRTWVGLSKEDKWEIVQATERDDRGYVMALVEARLKELNT